MTSKKRTGGSTAEEFLAELEADPTWVADNKAMEASVEKRAAALVAEQRPLLKVLHAAGFKVKSVEDFHERMTGKINTPAAALPILFKHLDRQYSEELRQWIATRLAVPDARPYWRDIKRRFIDEVLAHPYESGMSYGWGLACAVGAIVESHKDLLPEFIEMLRDRNLGKIRVVLVGVLTHYSRNPLAQRALHDLRSDPDLQSEINRYFHQRELRARRQARRPRRMR